MATATSAAAHLLDGGRAAVLAGSATDTARVLGTDAQVYRHLLDFVVNHWSTLAPDVLGPLRWPDHPFDLARFDLNALQPATMPPASPCTTALAKHQPSR